MEVFDIVLDSFPRDLTKEMKRAFTFLELMITVACLAVLAGVVIYILRAVLLTWSAQETRSGIDISLDRTIQQMVRDLRPAREVRSSNRNEIRFSQDLSTYYIYYLYNVSDSYPPNFTQGSYELKKATLSGSGGINGTFSYGSGDIKITDVLPLTSNLSVSSNNIATIDLSIKRQDQTKRLRTQVRPRNL